MTFSQYCLTNVHVPFENVQRFLQLMKKVMPLFESYDWRLLLRLELATTVASTGGQKATHPNEYIHLWRIPELSSLLTVMNAAADNFDYVALDDLVAEEIQHSAVGLYYDPRLDGSDASALTFPAYLVENLDLVRDPGTRNEFTVQMNTTTVMMKADHGWHLLTAANYTTGTINRYVHIWGIESFGDDRRAADTTRLFDALRYYRESDTPWSEQYRKTVKTWRQTWYKPVEPA